MTAAFRINRSWGMKYFTATQEAICDRLGLGLCVSEFKGQILKLFQGYINSLFRVCLNTSQWLNLRQIYNGSAALPELCRAQVTWIKIRYLFLGQVHSLCLLFGFKSQCVSERVTRKLEQRPVLGSCIRILPKRAIVCYAYSIRLIATFSNMQVFMLLTTEFYEQYTG